MDDAAGASTTHASIDAAAAPRRLRVGAVSYLNTLPLVEGLNKLRDMELILAAPSHLLDLLLDRTVEVALAPIVDAQLSPEPLALLPCGVIGCEGRTMTVRLFSAGPIERITRVHADTDSHTSIALLRIILSKRHGIAPDVVPFDARERIVASRVDDDQVAGDGWPESLLIIGDKVVTDSPPAIRYPHQLDLGEAWRELTELPFVYAAWMCRAEDVEDPDVCAVASILDRQRRHNRTRIDWIATSRAPDRRWPGDLARTYLGRLLRYDVGPRERQAVDRFFDLAQEVGIYSERRPTVWAGA